MPRGPKSDTAAGIWVYFTQPPRSSNGPDKLKCQFARMPNPKAEFTEPLECPKCGLTGSAEISDRSAYFGGDHDTR